MTNMKRLLIAVAMVSLLALAAFAQTPTPPARTAATNPAPAASTGGTGAEGKVAILNTGAFRQGINELRVKLDGLNTEFEPKKKEYEALQNAVNDLKNKIQTQGNTVSAAVRNQWVEEGTDKETKLKRMGEDLQTLADKRLQEVSQPIYDKIAKVLESYCQQRGIVMVLDAGAAQQAGVLLFAQAATDITQDFMNEYNKANPAAAAPAPKK
jgi:Skp family chaperone for outer membrane proteins